MTRLLVVLAACGLAACTYRTAPDPVVYERKCRAAGGELDREAKSSYWLRCVRLIPDSAVYAQTISEAP